MTLKANQTGGSILHIVLQTERRTVLPAQVLLSLRISQDGFLFWVETELPAYPAVDIAQVSKQAREVSLLNVGMGALRVRTQSRKLLRWAWSRSEPSLFSPGWLPS
jgi:hypothetical protein